MPLFLKPEEEGCLSSRRVAACLTCGRTRGKERRSCSKNGLGWALSFRPLVWFSVSGLAGGLLRPVVYVLLCWALCFVKLVCTPLAFGLLL